MVLERTQIKAGHYYAYTTQYRLLEECFSYNTVVFAFEASGHQLLTMV